MPENSLPKVVVLDARPADSGDMDWSAIQALGDVTLYDGTKPEEVAERVADAEVIYTNKVKMPASVFEAAPKLKFISILATGFDVIDLEAARAHGVTVSNVPGYSSASTAQTAIALLLELTHRAGLHDDAVKAGEWTQSPTFSFWKQPLTELDGKTLVLVGTGSIGTKVGKIAEALGMTVLSAQLPGRESSKSNAEFPRVPLDEALPQADVVSLHCPATPQTKGLVDATFIAKMKSSALLINTARGVVVNEADVAAALKEGKLAGFAADVLSVEPPPADNPLLSAPNTVITPHIAWGSVQARGRLFEISAANLKAYLDGAPQNVVS